MNFQEEIQFGLSIYFGKLSSPVVLLYLQWVSLIIHCTERKLIGVKVLSNLLKHNQIKDFQQLFFLELLSLELSVDFQVPSSSILTSELMDGEVNIKIRIGKRFLKHACLHLQVLLLFIGLHIYFRLVFQMHNQASIQFLKIKHFQFGIKVKITTSAEDGVRRAHTTHQPP